MKKKNIITLFILCFFVMQSPCMSFSFKKPKIKQIDIEKSIDATNNNFNLTDTQWISLEKEYKKITDERNIMLALECLKKTVGNYSRDAILGANLTEKPIKIQFKNLSEIRQEMANYDALGTKAKGRLYININKKHADAPAIALAALLAHEALHQDSYNSINEETYAWTMEAAVWTQLSEAYKDMAKSSHPLVKRENIVKKMFIKGNYTDKYIRMHILNNPAYQQLPTRSPGFETVNL